MMQSSSVRGRDFNDMLVFKINGKDKYITYSELNRALRDGFMTVDDEETKQQYDELVGLGSTLGAQIVSQEGDITKILFYQRQHYYLLTVNGYKTSVQLYK